MLINTSGIIVQVSILVNGNNVFHLYISESVKTWYILSLKTMSSGVTLYPDFKSIPEKTLMSWRTPFMVVLLKPPEAHDMSRWSIFVSELFKYLTFLEPL